MGPLRLLLAFAWVCCAIQAFAQEPAPQGAPTVPAPAEKPAPPSPIAAPEVVTRAEELKVRLRDVEGRIAPDASEQEIEQKLPELAAKVAEREPRAEKLLTSASSEGLADLLGAWSARAEQLTGWRHALTRRALAIEGELDALAASEDVWKATLDAGAKDGYPPSTLERARDSLRAIVDSEKLVKKRRAQILSLQNDVAQQELVVSGLIDRIQARQVELRSHILTPDAAPLWSAEAYVPPEGMPPLVERMRQTFVANLGELVDFCARSRAELGFALVCLFVVLAALALGREHVAKLAETDPTLAATARIFARPMSAAIVVAVVTSMPLFRRMPSVAVDALRLIVLVPMLRILPLELWQGFRPGLLVLAGLFVTASARSPLAFAPVLDRLLLLAEALTGASLLLWLSRPGKRATIEGIGRFAGAVRPAASVGLVLLVLAAFANLVGLASAARVGVRATLGSAFVAVALYALARVVSGVATVALRSELAHRARALRDHGELVRRRTLSVAAWSTGALWAWATLRLFQIWDEALGMGRAILTSKLEIGTVTISLGNVVGFVLALWLANLLSRFLRFVLESDVLPHFALPRGVPYAVSTGVHYTILLLGLVLALGAAGIDLSRFSLLAGAFGVGIGFGLQNVVNNFVSGLILLFERPIQTGDSIDVGGVVGQITRIGIRSSTLRTPEGADVIVPNGTLISDRVVNWTFADRDRRIDVAVGVAYGTDPEKVLALLLEAARANPELAKIPEPMALFVGFGDSSLNFEIRAWVRFDVFVRVRSDLAVAVNAALRDAGIEIPFPQRDVHLKVEGGTTSFALPHDPEAD